LGAHTSPLVIMREEGAKGNEMGRDCCGKGVEDRNKSVEG
jgi:hypothetical protein